MTSPTAVRYDPWLDLNQNWPHVDLVVESMSGDLLGEVRGDGAVIALRADTSGAQRRCTLAHEIVHLERGLPVDDSWLYREEALVHRETARRLIPLAELGAAIRAAGGDHDRAALAQALDVDRDTLDVRLADLQRWERVQIRRRLRRHSA
ncbi:MAG TPA: ImmA/IrrE family metallo-endopeptidase [Jatrophihabitans sp.]|jgi:hypothetical protein